MRYEMIQTPNGAFPVAIPNSTVDGDGFYVSYNNHDIGLYGCDTTALVVGQMERFYILKGDHRDRYAPLLAQGFDVCLSYYKQHIAESHPYSDKL